MHAPQRLLTHFIIILSLVIVIWERAARKALIFFFRKLAYEIMMVYNLASSIMRALNFMNVFD